jgi:transposase-like protein
MNLDNLADHFSSEEKAREYLEQLLWPNGAVCPHCGLVGKSYRLAPQEGGKSHVRPGVWKCGVCRKQFTVKVGTIFEDSHIPLQKWLLAIHLVCSSKKGISAHQLHRMLGVTYKSAWFMAHRIRYAMTEMGMLPKLEGTVEIDETYVGGKIKGKGTKAAKDAKVPVVSLVERKGRVRSFQMERVTAKNLKPIVKENVHGWSNVMTDDAAVYPFVLGRRVASHDVIQHNTGVYVRHEGDRSIHTNTVEGFFSILKRGIIGTFHHVSRIHLHRYLHEFDFRYNDRKITDGERTEHAIKNVVGKRLRYYGTTKEGETAIVPGLA